MKKKVGIGKILFRYIFFEILLYSFVAFLFFFVIFFVNNLLVTVQENIIKNVSASLILKFFLYSVPIVIANAAPYSAFVGTLMCLGRFVSDYEFVSLTSLGIPDRKILLPVLAAALCMSGINFAVNDFLIPATAQDLNDTVAELRTENPSMQIQSYSIKKTDKTVIASGEVSKQGIDDILLIDNSQNDTIYFLSAKHAQLVKQDNREIIMSLEPIAPQFFSVKKNNLENFEYAYGEKLSYNFLQAEFPNDAYGLLGPGQYSSYDLAKKIKLMREDESTSSAYLNWYNLEFQKKFSIPFGAAFFILLAYTISRNLKLYNQGLGFVIGLFISVCYWAIFMAGQSLSLDGKVNGIFAAWLPNCLLLFISCVLILKTVRR